MNPMVLAVIKWLIPVIAPVLVEFIKKAMAGQWEKIPDYLKPLLTALIGAILGGISGDPAALEVTVPMGAAMGMAGSKLRDMAVGKSSVDATRPAGVD